VVTTPSNRERLLKAIPRDRQLVIAKSLEKHGIDDDEPLLLLCIEILEGEARHIQAEFKRYHPLLKEIYQEKTWHKLLTSKIMTWVVGPVIAGAIIFGSIMFARKAEIQALEKIVDDPKSIAVAMTEGATAMKDSRQDIQALQSIGILLNLPQSVVAIRNEKLVIQLPKNEVEITEDGEKVTIRLGSSQRQLERILNNMGGKDK
jgi:hypothetical protein